MPAVKQDTHELGEFLKCIEDRAAEDAFFMPSKRSQEVDELSKVKFTAAEFEALCARALAELAYAAK